MTRRFRPVLDRLEGRALLAPVVNPITPINAEEGQSVAATITGTADPGMSLTWSLASPPAGATIGATTGVFFWQPPDAQAIYSIDVVASECDGVTATAQLTVRVFDNSPVVNAGTNTTISAGDNLARPGSFSDPDADSWTATVDYGDNSGVQPLAIGQDKSFRLDHIYSAVGVYTVTVRIYDSQGGQGLGAFGITVVAASTPPVQVPVAGLVAGVDYGFEGQRWASNIITYSFTPDGTQTANLAGPSNLNAALTADTGSTAAWQGQFIMALDTWSAVANIKFVEVPDSGLPEGTPGIVQGNSSFGDIRVSGRSFGPGSTLLAQSYFPDASSTLGGDVEFNTSYQFSVGGANTANGSATYDIYTVALHELGIALGLAEVKTPTEAADATYHGVLTGLGPGDIFAVTTLYGPGPYSVPGAPLIAPGTQPTPKQAVETKAAQHRATSAYRRLIAHETRLEHLVQRQVAQIVRRARQIAYGQSEALLS